MDLKLRGVKPQRGEHYTDSLVVNPQCDLTKLNRGWMNADPPEFQRLVGSIEEVIATRVPGAFVELGCKLAGSTRTILQVFDQVGESRELVSIDPDPKAKRYHDCLPKGRARRLLIGRSQDPEILSQVPETLAWVLIDGCHCFDCAKADIDLYCPRVPPGGIVLLHDCDLRVQERPKPSQPCGGTRKRVGVYDAMMRSEILQEQFYLLHLVEGAKDPNGHFWNGLAIWRRRD